MYLRESDCSGYRILQRYFVWIDGNRAVKIGGMREVLDRSILAFGATRLRLPTGGIHAAGAFAETPRLVLRTRHQGPMTAVCAVPKEHRVRGRMREWNIEAEVVAGFNRLIYLIGYGKIVCQCDPRLTMRLRPIEVYHLPV